MAKTVIKAKCIKTDLNENNSLVRFAVELPPLPAAKEGEQPQRIAKTIVQINFNDSEGASPFKPGKQYTITIE